MNHAFAFPAEAGPHFTDPGEVSRPSRLVTYLDGLSVQRPSPMQVLTESEKNFVDKINDANHYTMPPTANKGK